MRIPIIYKYIPKTIHTEERVKGKPSFFKNIEAILNRRLIRILVTAFLLIMFLDGMLTATLSYIIEVKFTNKINMLGIIIVLRLSLI